MMRQPRLITDERGFQLPKQQRHWSFNANAGWQVVSNSIGNIVTYNETTGGRISRPENINGNWNANFGMGFTIGLDTLNRWDISGSINANYAHRVGYVNLNRSADSERNVTHTYNVNPSISLSFRNDWLSISLNGRTTYARTDNRLQASNNLTTWNFSYGAEMNLNFPFGLSFTTDVSESSRRGYSTAAMNTNEFLWNAKLSQSFLKGNALTISLEWNDILQNRSNISRTLTAMQSSDSEYNSIYSYGMIHIIYKLNIFGGKNAMGTANADRGNFGGRPSFGGGGRAGGGGPGRR
jgi:hypothetical protein